MWNLGVDIKRETDSVDEVVCEISNTSAANCPVLGWTADATIDSGTMTVNVTKEGAQCTDSVKYFCAPKNTNAGQSSSSLLVISTLR